MVKEKIKRALASLRRITNQLLNDEFLTDEKHKRVTEGLEIAEGELMEAAEKYEPAEEIEKNLLRK